MPPLGRLIAADDGAFWVERIDGGRPAEVEFRKYFRRPSESAETSATWDVFDARGRFLAAVPLPARFAPMAVTERTVTGVQRDEFDVEYVVTYRIRAEG